MRSTSSTISGAKAASTARRSASVTSTSVPTLAKACEVIEYLSKARGSLGKCDFAVNLKIQGCRNLTEPPQARRAVVRGFVSLDLLFANAEFTPQLILTHSRRDPALDQSAREFVERFDSQGTTFACAKRFVFGELPL